VTPNERHFCSLLVVIDQLAVLISFINLFCLFITSVMDTDTYAGLEDFLDSAEAEQGESKVQDKKSEETESNQQEEVTILNLTRNTNAFSFCCFVLSILFYVDRYSVSIFLI